MAPAIQIDRKTWPMPAGKPKPALETYKAPSGPKVIAVGNDNPLMIVVRMHLQRPVVTGGERADTAALRRSPGCAA